MRQPYHGTNNRDRRRVGLMLIAILATACGAASLDHVVPSSALREMSRRGQVWIFDAENEIIVALDKLDGARDKLRLIRSRKAHAERGVEAAKRRGKPLGVTAAQGWLRHIVALEAWARAAVSLHRFGVVVARATYELAKAQVIHQEDLVAGEDFSIKQFRQQLERLKRRFDQQRAAVAKRRKKAREEELRWWNLRQQFVAKTGDYESGLWID